MWHWQLRSVVREYQLQIVVICISILVHAIILLLFVVSYYWQPTNAVSLHFIPTKSTGLVSSTTIVSSQLPIYSMQQITNSMPVVQQEKVGVPMSTTATSIMQKPSATTCFVDTSSVTKMVKDTHIAKKEKKRLQKKRVKLKQKKSKKTHQTKEKIKKPVLPIKPVQPVQKSVVPVGELIPQLRESIVIPKAVSMRSMANNTVNHPHDSVITKEAISSSVTTNDIMENAQTSLLIAYKDQNTITNDPLFGTLQRAIYEQWKLPPGISSGLKATVQVCITQQGQIRWKIVEPSGNFLYDIAIRTALARVPVDAWPRNKSLSVSLLFG